MVFSSQRRLGAQECLNLYIYREKLGSWGKYITRFLDILSACVENTVAKVLKDDKHMDMDESLRFLRLLPANSNLIRVWETDIENSSFYCNSALSHYL